MARYYRPDTLAEALAIRAEKVITVLAGGTDIVPARTARAGWGDMSRTDILDVSRLQELRGIDETADGFRFGALTTWTELRRAALPAAFAGWQAAAKDVGGRQVQNRGTIAGNLCTASPAGDGIPCLLSLDAAVELTSVGGVRTVPVGDFVTGYRTTALRADELVTAVVVPQPAEGAVGAFAKLGARRYLVISIAMAAGVIAVGEDGRIRSAALAVGACSARAQRLLRLEAALVGVPAGAAVSAVEPELLDELTPINDIRASGDYRRAAALTLVRDIVGGLAGDGERRVA